MSLAAASSNPKETRRAQEIANRFTAAAGWQLARVASVAGCLAYTKYGWFVRLFMRAIARKEGGSLDTSRDHVYTDWQQVDEVADRLSTAVLARGNLRGAAKFSLPVAS